MLDAGIQAVKGRLPKGHTEPSASCSFFIALGSLHRYPWMSRYIVRELIGWAESLSCSFACARAQNRVLESILAFSTYSAIACTALK